MVEQFDAERAKSVFLRELSVQYIFLWRAGSLMTEHKHTHKVDALLSFRYHELITM